MKTAEATDFVPFDWLEGNYGITSYGDVVFGIEVRMCDVYTMNESVTEVGLDSDAKSSEVNVIYHSWKLALSSLEDGVIVQKYNFFYSLPYEAFQDNGCLTRKWNDDKFKQRDVMFDKVYITVSFPLEKRSKNQKRKPLYNRVNEYKSFSNIPEKESMFRNFVSSVSQKGFMEDVRVLESQELLDLMYKVWNVDVHAEPLLNDIEKKDSGLIVGNKSVRILTSRKLAKNINGFTSANRTLTDSSKIESKTNYVNEVKLPTSYLFPIGMGMPFDHILVETIRRRNNDESESELTKEWKGLNFLVGLKIRDAINKRSNIDLYKDIRSKNDFKCADWSLTVIIADTDLELLEKKTNLVKDVSSKQLGILMAVENFNSWKQFYSCMPGCGNLSTNLRLGFVETFAYMTHLESFMRGNRDGVVFSDLFGRPFLQQLWMNDKVPSANAVVFGPTGQGKSVLINQMMDQFYWSNHFIFLIDVGGSYRRVTQLNKGVYIDSNDVTTLRFNPFLDCYCEDGKYYPELDYRGLADPLYVEYLCGLIMECWGLAEFKPELITVIGIWIRGFFRHYNENGGELNFDAFCGFVMSGAVPDNFKKYVDLDSFELQMKPFMKDGQLGFLLNAEQTYSVDNRWVAFDLAGVLKNKRLVSPVMLIIMQMFQRKIIEKFGERVCLWFDEAVDFLQGKSISGYIGESYRKIRKEGGQIGIITQSLDYLDHLDPLVKSSILTNSSIKIILDHGADEKMIKKYQEELKFSDSEAELMRHQTPVDGKLYRIPLIKFGGQKAFLCRIEISSETYALYQTTATEIKLIDELIRRCGSVEGAVKTFVEQKSKEL